MEIRSVGIIGAGQMGSGIATVVAQHGYDVALHDVSPERVQSGIDAVKKNLNRQLTRGHIDQSAVDDALSHVRSAENLEEIGQTDLAIEAATENEEIKKSIFRQLTPLLKPEA